MSRIYDKSKSEKYSKYFLSEKELGHSLPTYQIEQIGRDPQQNFKYKSWETGKVGVPVYYNASSKTIAVDHTDSHTLVVGPTGSKKSRLVAMPLVRILGSAGESMIISDPKGEIYNRAAAFLEKKQYKIYVLNLRAPEYGQGWNPLAIPYYFYTIGEIDKACEFANDIAQNLILSKLTDQDPFWENSSSSFFYGLVLLLFKYCKEHDLDSSFAHIGNVVKLRNYLFQRNGRGNVIPEQSLWNYAKQDNIIQSALIGTVETADDTRGGILSTFDQKTKMFSIQPNLLDMLGKNDIEFDRIGTEPTAVFLIVPDEKTGYHGLVSLFIKQSYEYLIYKAQTKDEIDGFHVGVLKNRLNYVLDEFSSLPTINDFPAMITAARSRNIRFTLFIQSKHQLLQRYKEESETIQTNCNNWIFLTSRELQLLEEVSKLCGTTLEENPRPVLSVTDLQRLDKETGEALLLCGRSKPCITHLADISVYDSDRFTVMPAHRRDVKQAPELEIAIKPNVSRPEDMQQRFTMPGQLPSLANNSATPIPGKMEFDTEAIIRRIDQKIAELEAQEKAEQEANVETAQEEEEATQEEPDEEPEEESERNAGVKLFNVLRSLWAQIKNVK